MGGFGSGRQGGRLTVESAVSLDIDELIRAGVIQPGSHAVGRLKYRFNDDESFIQFEALAGNPWDSWIRLQYAVTDCWSGRPHDIDDKILLAASEPRLGGLRWWFVCPYENRRVRKLYLPLGGLRFRSRLAYRLAYASQREAAHHRAMRRARNICRRLGSNPDDCCYPEKPARMRWVTYSRLIDDLAAAERVADERFMKQACKMGLETPSSPILSSG
jgi:hypothetical protein